MTDKTDKPPRGGRRAPAPADPPEVRHQPPAGGRPKKPAAAAPQPATGRGAGRESYQETRARRTREKETDTLRLDLRAFAQARPAGWGHDDWLSFLDVLKERGHDTSDTDAIGLQLERERLAVVLSEVQGLGPRRVESLVTRFDTVWSLRHASVDDVAAVQGIPRSLAERIVEHVREG